MLKDARSRQLEVDYKQFLGRTSVPGNPFPASALGTVCFQLPRGLGDLVPHEAVSSVGPKPLETDNFSGSQETDNSEETLDTVNRRWFGNQTLRNR